MGKNGLRFFILNPIGKKRCGGILNPMGKRRRRRRRCGLDWIFNPMGMRMRMGKRRRRRRSGVIFNPMGRKKRRCGDGDDHLHLLLLPEDVLIQILLCLPVISLLRFKSVCKSWLKLIHSSFFIDLHTTTSSSSSKFGGTFILQATEPLPSYREREFTYHKYEHNYVKLFILSSGSGDGEYDNNNNDKEEEDDDDDQKKKKKVFKVDDLEFSRFYKDYELHDTLRMVGSCNGIICLHDTEVMEPFRGISKQHYYYLMDVCLWNPATRQFRILPGSIPIEEKPYYLEDPLNDFAAFGFDVKTKDYKVLRITPWDYTGESEEGGCMCSVQVYSLSTDSWRLLEDINSLPVLVPEQQNLFDNHGIYLNGSYFFVGRKPFTDGKRKSMLLSFDFAKEIFTPMQLPKNVSRYNDMVLSSLGGKLALFHGGYEYSDIWVLNEQHGSGLGVLNKESWTKLHSFQMKSCRYSQPRCISNNGEFALISTWENTFQLFNLVTKEAIKDFTIGSRGTKVYRANVYKESLVSII